MDPLSVGLIVLSSLFGFIGTIATNFMNSSSVAQTNEQNQQNLESSWQRDDSEMQRRKADAVAAGFSPLASLGGSSGNTNPSVLTAPQYDFTGLGSGFRDSVSVANQYQQTKTMKENAAAQNKLIETQNQALIAETEHKKDVYIRELAKLDLGLSDTISTLLTDGVISEDEIPETIKFIKAHKNQALTDQRARDERAVAAQEKQASASAYANTLKAQEIQNTQAEREWQHNSEEKTHTVRNKVSFSVMGQDYELEVTDTTNSSTTAVMAGVSPSDSAHPVASYDKKGFISYPVINDRGDRQCFYVGISTQKGLPCYSDGRFVPTFYVAIPTTTGISYYKINRGDISMSNNGKAANWPKNDWDKFWSN